VLKVKTGWSYTLTRRPRPRPRPSLMSGISCHEISFMTPHIKEIFCVLILQDEKHPAENLLNGNVNGRKWLISASRTVTSMAATFQLAECCVISSVHIGNNIHNFKQLI
jgi:hypothetical protein